MPWIRTSERIAFGTCQYKWYWGYVESLRSQTTGTALKFGLLVHEALELYYKPGVKRGPHPAETFNRLFTEQLVEHERNQIYVEDAWLPMQEVGIDMLESYVEHYGPDSRWKVLHSEHAFHWPVTTKVDGRMVRFVYVGVMDVVVLDRATGEIWVVDHKTTGDDPTTKGPALVFDEQSGAYWAYGVQALRRDGILKKNQDIAGILFNFLKKSKRDDRPVNDLGQALNQDGTVSKKQPAPRFHREPSYRGENERLSVEERVESQALLMSEIRAGLRSPYKVPGTLHSPHCNWCEFRDFCELHESRQPGWERLRDQTMIKHDPYTQHEIKEGDTAR